MTLRKKTIPLVVTVLFALLFTLPAAVIPSAIAQEEEEDDASLLDDDDDNLASGIVSEVLDDGSSGDAQDESNQDATNTATEDSNQEQDVDEDNVSEFGDDAADLDDTNVAVPLGIPIDVQDEEVVEETPITPTPPEEEEPPEFVAFCLVETIIPLPTTTCFNTSEECERGEEILSGVECEGFESPPPGALDCSVAGGVIVCEAP